MFGHKTLLELAKESKAIRKRRRYDPEFNDMAVAWVKGEITLTQMNVALKRRRESSSILYSVAGVMRELYLSGNLIIKK